MLWLFVIIYDNISDNSSPVSYDRPNRNVPAHRVTLTPAKEQEQDGDEAESDDGANSRKSPRSISQKYVDDNSMSMTCNGIYF